MLMTQRARQKSRTLIGWRIGELGLVLVLITVVVWLTSAIQDVRRRITLSQLAMEQKLEGAGVLAALELEVDRRQGDLDQIFIHVTDQAGIGEVVAVLEREAARFDVSLRIPLVEEVVPESSEEVEEGEDPPPPGPLREVQLRLVVRGTPQQTLRFFYAVEHLPYLLRTDTWHLGVGSSSAVPGIAAAVPGRGPDTGPLADSSLDLAEQNQLADLTLQLLLTVKNESGS